VGVVVVVVKSVFGMVAPNEHELLLLL